MRNWLIPKLQCVECNGTIFQKTDAAVDCMNCRRLYESAGGITSFFPNSMSSVPLKELDAIRKLDEGSTELSRERLKNVIVRLDRNKTLPTSEELEDFSCLQHLVDSKRQIEELLSEFPLPSGTGEEPPVLLEVGADHCWASNLFLDRGYRVVATDISDHLQLASRADDENLCRLKADMNRLPVQDGSMDVVWSTSAAHHSWNLQQTFKEAARILRSGGRLYFCCEPMPSGLRYPFGHDFGHEEKLLGINECWIPRGSWIGYCREAGFENVELVFPNLSDAEIRNRLKSRKLPELLAPVARPFLKALQVSIHLIARKRAT